MICGKDVPKKQACVIREEEKKVETYPSRFFSFFKEKIMTFFPHFLHFTVVCG